MANNQIVVAQGGSALMTKRDRLRAELERVDRELGVYADMPGDERRFRGGVPNQPGSEYEVDPDCYPHCGGHVRIDPIVGHGGSNCHRRNPRHGKGHVLASAKRMSYFEPDARSRKYYKNEEGLIGPPAGNWDPTVTFRGAFPETFIGDAGPAVDPFLLDGGRLLESYCSDMGDDAMSGVSVDYPFVGNVASARRAVETLWTIGVHDETTVTATIAGTTATATFTNGAGPTIGFRLDWGLQALNFAPFDLNITSIGWLAGFAASPAPAAGIASTQPNVDRTMIIRVRGDRNGGSLFIPWAYRAGQGMNYPMHCLAYATATSGPAAGAPIVKVTNLPANIASAFSMNVRLLTAYSQNTADMARLFDLYT